MQPCAGDEQEDEARRAIENDIVPGAGARGDIALMPFVERGDEEGAEPGEERDAAEPGAGGIESMTPAPEQKEAEDAIAGYVSGLAQIEMEDEKLWRLIAPNSAVASL